tara:strand:+ start:514 stop:993 length:480 start_codon:yes stop_codon:yes gene_type:complete
MIYDYKKFRGIQHGYRSGLEDKIAQQLKKANISVEYETLSIKYTVPAVIRTYTPDFFLPNGIVIESKGRFTAEDRKKHLLIKKLFPELDLRFVFYNSKSTLRKGSRTTYADWCDKNNFLYCDKYIDENWLSEKINLNSFNLAMNFLKTKKPKPMRVKKK